ncbi:hypothetical protein HWV62_28364 [Athelia sp. TMB]|nr:hypothetical protein HWV62_28364 [Athelia sp. TMB]
MLERLNFSDTLSECIPSSPFQSNKRVRTTTGPDSAPPSDVATDTQSDTSGASKRLRNSSSKPEAPTDDQHSIFTEHAFERRRVNPESLALRLGSELVRDLDAIIPAGSKEMPSFEARKKIQQRHGIDRRHIYDYYHSKGLRVIKEGAGTSNKQSFQATIASQLVPRSRRQVLVHSSSLEPPVVVVKPRKKPGPKPKQLKPSVTEPKKQKAFTRKAEPKTTSPAKQTCPASLVQPPQSPDINTIAEADFFPSSFFTNPMVPIEYSEDDFQSNALPNLNTFFNSERTAGSTHRTRPVYPTPLFEKLAVQDADIVALSEMAQNVATCGATSRSDKAPMTQAERMEFYDFLDRVIGPAQGIQESAGTYKKYMENQSRRFFDKSSSATHKISVRSKEKNSTLYSASQPQDSSGDFVNWRSWLGPGSNQGILLPAPAITKPAAFYNFDGTFSDMALKEQTATSGRVPEDFFISALSPAALGDTFDDLFPDLEDSILGGDGPFESLSSRSEAQENPPTPSPLLLPPDLHRSQSDSPDPESSPFVQTPASIYQQFTQVKDMHLGEAHPVFRAAHRVPAVHIQSDVDRLAAKTHYPQSYSIRSVRINRHR